MESSRNENEEANKVTIIASVVGLRANIASEISAGLDEIRQLALALSIWDDEGGFIPKPNEA